MIQGPDANVGAPELFFEDDFPWQDLADRIASRDCVPILGGDAFAEGQKVISQFCAPELGDAYPLDPRPNLASHFQYNVRTRDRITHVKRLARNMLDLEEPRHGDDFDIHTYLARKHLPLYLTTNYDLSMERALRTAKFEPELDYLPRDETSKTDRTNNIKNLSDRPPANATGDQFAVFDDLNTGFRLRDTDTKGLGAQLVYHLRGVAKFERSMAVSEDDHLDLIETIANAAVPLPATVNNNLIGSSLLLIGFRLDAWDFRVVLRLIKRAKCWGQPSVTVQLSPDSDQRNAAKLIDAQRYISRYIDGHLGLEEAQRPRPVIGTTADFLRKLDEYMPRGGQ